MTAAVPAPFVRLRPQPAGIYPPPAAFLLLAEDVDASAVLSLMSGDPKALPPGSARFYRLALDGRIDAAYESIDGDRAIDFWNRFILRPDLPTYETLRSMVPPEMLPLAGAAAFAAGLIDRFPASEGLDGELQALVLLTAASHAIERDEPARAIDLLEQALAHAESPSPLLAAQILHQLGTLEREQDPEKAVERYRHAIRLAGDTPLVSLRAELWLNLGLSWQHAARGRRGALLEAAKALQESIRCGLSLENLPQMYALAQNSLALTYLAMPARDASDQLRMGIAVQCLREALKVFHRDTHTEMWASTQLNLANALQYLPSSHPEDNLRQAVDLYEELLEVRSAALDPLGYARLLANQANALAHLGIFAPALEKLNQAHKLFHWHGEPGMAASVLELAAEVNARLGERTA